MKLLYLLFTPCGESGAGRTKRVIQYFATISVGGGGDNKKDAGAGKIKVCLKNKTKHYINESIH